LYELHKCIHGRERILKSEYVNPNEVWVCESMIDCILLWQSHKWAVAMNGLGNKLALQQLQDLPVRALVLATDNDEAGLNARDRIKSIIKNKIIYEAILPRNRKDIGECTPEEIQNIKVVL
jgi:DNA primase